MKIKEILMMIWITLCVCLLFLIGIFCVNLKAGTILTSTATLVETEDYAWSDGMEYNRIYRDSPFYKLVLTTESVALTPYVFGEYRNVWWKWKKVYYEIASTECFEWEKVRKPYPRIPDSYCFNCPDFIEVHGDCKKERVYMADGRVLWREVKSP